MEILILGAGYAGLACALRLANRARGRASITLVNASESFVDRIRLHQVMAGQSMPTLELRTMLRGSDVRLRVGRVMAIDPEGSVLVDDERIRFDRLVIALGSRTNADAIPGVDEYAYTLDAGSMEGLARDLPGLAASGGHLAVVGGGLSGIEAAAELAESHPKLRVTLLTGGAIGEGFSEAGRRHLLHGLTRLGVAVEEKTTVHAIADNGLELEDRALSADAVVFAGGFVAPALLQRSGLPMSARGQVLVDGMLRAIGHPNIHVVGDAAVMDAPPYPMAMGCKTAVPMGIHAAESLARVMDGREAEPFDYADTVICISLGRRDALVQPMKTSGKPTRWILRGRLGALVKEGICRGVLWSLDAERRNKAVYGWRRTGRPMMLPARDGKALPA